MDSGYTLATNDKDVPMSRRPKRPRNTRGPKRPMFKLSFNYSGGGGFDPACREVSELMTEQPDGTLCPCTSTNAPSSALSSNLDDRTRAALGGSLMDGLFNAFDTQDPLSGFTQVASAGTVMGGGAVGTPLPHERPNIPKVMAARVWINPTRGKVRGCDSQGCGHYGASRAGGTRSHNGVDYVAAPGQDVVAVTDGTISKIGYPYRSNLAFRYIEITTNDNHTAREFYVLPAPKIAVGVNVSVGQVIGNYQALGPLYPGITEHVHVEIRYQGKLIDPTNIIPTP